MTTTPHEEPRAPRTTMELGCADQYPPIAWVPPPPRSGLGGALDRFIGPGPTGAELWLQTAIPLAAACVAVAWPVVAGHAWPWWKLVIVALLALDVIGGAITNSTQTAKRWYHQQGRAAKHHLGFVSVHAMQLLVVGGLFRGQDWVFVAVLYAFLLLGSVIIVASPRYLQRPIASSFYLAALVVTLGLVGPTPGLEWFGAMFFFKLFVAHLPFEAPLAPAPRAP